MTLPVTRAELRRFLEARSALLGDLGHLVVELETRVPLPRGGDATGYAYAERSDQQALLLLLVRLLSGVEAHGALLERGLVADVLRNARFLDALLRTIDAWSARLADGDSVPSEDAAAFWEGRPALAEAAPHGDLSPETLMELYGPPGSRFHVVAVGFPAWADALRDEQSRLHRVAATFGAVAVAFGHPGMHAFAIASGDAFLRALRVDADAPPPRS